MKEEAIRALEQFKQLHLSKPAVEADLTNGQADMVSESPEPTKENQMEQRNLGDLLSTWEEGEKAKKKNINYPEHIAPLKQRMMSALNNGARTVESVARYCKEGEKLISLQLNRWVSRGEIGKHIVPSSGNVKYYPFEIAKQMGILVTPKPINYWTKERREKADAKKRSSSVQTHEVQKAIQTLTPTIVPSKVANESKYIEFLEKRIVEWQTECRKLAKQISELENQVVQARADVVKAKTEPRNVTGEVQEVMKEVMELRSTVAYLESKLFGRK